jgi:hypothetical protein
LGELGDAPEASGSAPEARTLPDFLLIGAQKAGTTWLWEMLDRHPGTSLPVEKEIHYYGGAERYRQGPDWYASFFADVEPSKVTGEASTSYLSDRVPYWYNESRDLEYAPDLPPLPELVARDLPDARILVVLRDPVRRAVSAYHHWMRQGDLPPLVGLARTARSHPKLRIIEYGRYLRHLAAWRAAVPAERIHVLVYEEDIVADPFAALSRVYGFLGLDAGFRPELPRRRVHGSWSWTRCVVNYHSGPLRRWFARGRVGAFIDRHAVLERFAVRPSDIEYLQGVYRPDHQALEDLVGRSLECWDYGAGLLGH